MRLHQRESVPCLNFQVPTSKLQCIAPTTQVQPSPLATTWNASRMWGQACRMSAVSAPSAHIQLLLLVLCYHIFQSTDSIQKYRAKSFFLGFENFLSNFAWLWDWLLPNKIAKWFCQSCVHTKAHTCKYVPEILPSPLFVLEDVQYECSRGSVGPLPFLQAG